MVCSPVRGIQKLLRNGPIKEDSVEKLLNVQYRCHMLRRGRGCD